MSRPCKCRRVCFMPGVTYFKPAGIPTGRLTENCLSHEELESIRLRDIEGLAQLECGREMDISRPTFQRVLASARRKIADSLLTGKALRIEGGNYEFIAADEGRGLTETDQDVRESVREVDRNETGMRNAGGTAVTNKIAVISDDGKTISQHFGRAPYYVVVTLESGRIVSREQRAKAGHHSFGQQGEEHPAPGVPHGFDAGSQAKHAVMAQPLRDCKVLLAGGMGRGAYESLKSAGIESIITDVTDIDRAVGLYSEGKLPNLVGRLH
jgi:predicted DNA-binding protein (UPF0251 family)/predicted Fe-Mo cluster-binding NifX family protein